MTSWCPVCESPGRPVVSGSLSMADICALEAGAAVRVRERLPGIEPSHFCTRCPTFFRHRDRFYLTSIREGGVHGIAVWPHHQPRLRIEMGHDGLVLWFSDGSSVVMPERDVLTVIDDYFWTNGKGDIDSWARRRGFHVSLGPSGNGTLSVSFEPSGPHFPLLVVKSWLRARHSRTCEDVLDELELLEAAPLLFPPADLDS